MTAVPDSTSDPNQSIATSATSSTPEPVQHLRRVRYRDQDEPQGDGADSYPASAQVSGLVAVAAPASVLIEDTTQDYFLSPPPAKRLRFGHGANTPASSAIQFNPEMPQTISDPVTDSTTSAHVSTNKSSRQARTDAMDYSPDAASQNTVDTTGTLIFKPLWPGSNIDRRELVRLAMQAFEEMGYS